MPWGDRTGPWGLGPMTGRAAGSCAGYPVPGYMNPMPGFGWGFGFGGGWGKGGGWGSPWRGRGPFSYLPPWQRPGWLFGFGRGWGRGFGRGFRRWLWAYPWYGYPMPYAAYGAGQMPYGWGYGHPWSTYAMPSYAYPPVAYPYWYTQSPYMAYW